MGEELTMEQLNHRLTLLETEVREGMKPTLDDNTRMTREMYEILQAAKNGMRVMAAAGNGLVKVSDTIEKRPKTLLVSAIGSGTLYGFLTSGKAPEWFHALLKILAGA